ncbi:hypothetical protein [Capnocytophaga sp.]|uniref:hypothetical protein n=1 Tax=Capnocytophaga sp. TaxID=44737 RepID=UPI0026DAB128|nr:hypothetical protein [Capnocytophaga sp.]MDO5106540.1 hypothetical protein [Capnocytophaga sp.]
MYFQEEIKELNDNLQAFPKSENIFVENQAWLGEHFLPLISINLAELRPEWQGQTLHLLCPIEPYEGYIGDETKDFHNEFTAPNWLAFRLTDDNRYEFLGKEGYFLRSPLHSKNWDEDDKNYFQEMFDTYAQSKAQVAKDGFLIFPGSKPFRGKPNITNFLDKLGGEIWHGNWTTTQVPSAFKMTLPPAGTSWEELDKMPNNGIEISYKGNPFFMIGEVAGYNYCGGGADAIILLYEPVSRIVLFTFEFS